MFNMNQFTEEERNIVSRCNGRNEKAVVRNIRRMIPFLPVSELNAALSAIEKLVKPKFVDLNKQAFLLGKNA